jgi:hypothetical protein
MKLDELVDIETQVLADRDASKESLRARDEQIQRRIQPAESSRAGRLKQWIHEIRDDRSEPLPGKTIAQGYQTIRVAGVLLGALVGWGVAELALKFEGEDPINVLSYLWVFVFLQVLAVAFTLLIAPVLRWTSGSLDQLPLLGIFKSGIRGLLGLFWKRWASEKDEDRKARASRIWNQLKERRSLYYPAEQWLLLEVFQWTAIAFNVAAILRLVTLVAFSDLAFSWATTLELSAASFHDLMQVLSAPWSNIAPQAVPDISLIDATQWSRLKDDYLAGSSGVAASPQMAGQWWRFLLAATIFWGLIPRILLLVYARFRLGRFLKTLRFQTPEYARIDRRIGRVGVEIASEREDPGIDEPLPEAQQFELETLGSQRCAAARWREAAIGEEELRDLLEEHYGYQAGRVHETGSADYAADEAFLSVVSQKDVGAIAIAAEAWESPDKATYRFIERIRETAGPSASIVVVLVGGSEDEQTLWKNYLGQLQDPYLEVTAA